MAANRQLNPYNSGLATELASVNKFYKTQNKDTYDKNAVAANNLDEGSKRLTAATTRTVGQLFTMQNQIEDLQNKLRAKNAKIAQLEKSCETAKQKAFQGETNANDVQKMERQIAELKALNDDCNDTSMLFKNLLELAITEINNVAKHLGSTSNEYDEYIKNNLTEFQGGKRKKAAKKKSPAKKTTKKKTVKKTPAKKKTGGKKRVTKKKSSGGTCSARIM